MNVRKPNIRLISCTENPVETLFAAWAQSRPTQYPEVFDWLKSRRYSEAGDPDFRDVESNDVITAKHIVIALREGIIGQSAVDEVLKKITAMSIPVSESVHFTWGFSALPIEWREQAVRKRQWGFWLTSMREFGMDNFVSEGRWAPPVEGAGTPEAHEFLEDFMLEIEQAYNKLKELGMPQEIARKVIPLSATHNGTMFSNLRTLLDTLASRSCFIAQLDIWAPVLLGMVAELKKKHPLLGMIVSPPCFDRFSNEYQGCKYKLINENRLSKKDPYAPCPLYCMNEDGTERPSALADVNPVDLWTQMMGKSGVLPQYIQQGHRLLKVWKEIWQRDPFSGQLL